MQNDSGSGTLKGVNIATLVLTVLCMLSLLFAIPVLSVASTYVESNPEEFQSEIQEELEYELDHNSAYNGLSNSEKEMITSINYGASFFAIAMGILVVLALLNIVVFITNILAIANARRPDKLGAVFVLSIISAVLCFCEGAIVRGVLMIISAVYANRVRKSAMYTYQPPQQPGPGQPGPGQPGQPPYQQPSVFMQR